MPTPWVPSARRATAEFPSALAPAVDSEATRARGARETGIDALRGLAVVAMVGAHMVRYVLDAPYPFWLRLCSSLAGPAFILLVGYMVGRGHVRRPMPLRRYLSRTLALLLVASLVDVAIWGDAPFTSFDVLYVIALIPPVSCLVLRCSPRAALVTTILLLLLTPVLQGLLGYETGTNHPVWGRLQALLVDGWFPLFPWLGFGVLGALLGAFRERVGVQIFVRRAFLLGALLFVGGGAGWWLTGATSATPGGFAELFYPPSLAVLFAITGPEIWLLAHLSRPTARWPWRFLAVYGRTSLAMYVAHLALIRIFLGPQHDHQNIPIFLALFFAHAMVLWGLAWAVRRSFPAPRSFWGRLLLGG